MTTRAETIQALRAWLLNQQPEGTDTEIEEDTPLITSRLLTSLQITELLLEIEEMRGAPVQPHMLKPGSFATLAVIASTFFPERL